MTNQQLIDQYVTPHLWEGWLWCDGGWGPKNEILQRVARPTIDGHQVPVYIHPYTAVRPGRVSVRGTEGECTISSDEKYQVAFPGKRWRELVRTIDALRACGVREQKWTLTSWLSTQDADPTQAVYRMFIVAGPKPSDVEVRVLQGAWRPTFDNARAVAGWKA